MNPKEKAKELVFKYYDIFMNINEIPVGTHGILQWSKQSALIAVDEILNTLVGSGVFGFADDKVDEHWQKVKEEIIGMGTAMNIVTEEAIPTVYDTYLFPNGMVCSLDKEGEQIPALQGRYSLELHAHIMSHSIPSTNWHGFNSMEDKSLGCSPTIQ